jgi:hypothetical protein
MSEGVGSNWSASAAWHRSTLLGIPAGLDVLAILPFGYPADRIGRGEKPRKPLRAIAHRERYGQPFAQSPDHFVGPATWRPGRCGAPR